jgi:hypothetical protein
MLATKALTGPNGAKPKQLWFNRHMPLLAPLAAAPIIMPVMAAGAAIVEAQ